MDVADASLGFAESEASNILCAKKNIYGKSNGSDMETRSGYGARLDGVSERTGAEFHFSHRGDLLFHEVFYPEDARRFDNCQEMWQAVNRVEVHCNAQFAFEVVLPLSPDIALNHNCAMIREFAIWYRVRHGVPVQIDIHSGSRKGVLDGVSLEGAASEKVSPAARDNPHAHLLMPTRVLGPKGFGAKTRHLNPPFYRGRVMEEEQLRYAWADLQQRYCQRHGISLRIEPTGFVPQPRIGPPSGWKGRSDVIATLDLVRRANTEAACDPAQTLAKLTENNASFTDNDLERLLSKHLAGEADAEKRIAVARADVFASTDLEELFDKESGDWSGRYSTRQVREQEAWGIANLVALADPNSEEAANFPAGKVSKEGHGSGAAHAHAIHAALARHPLLTNEPDQRAAFDYVVAPGLVKVIEGRAGTGKSYTLAAIREAFEDPDPVGRPRARVIGLSHMNMVKEDMKADGFHETYTVHHMLQQLQKTNGACWSNVAMVAVDETAMLSTAQLAGTLPSDKDPGTVGLLEWARRTGTKLTLVGDHKQLPNPERSGLFEEIVKRLERLGEEFRSRELSKVRRQRDPGDRVMAEDLARYDFAKAIHYLDRPRITATGAVRPGRITWCTNQTRAIDALVATWTREAAPIQDGAPDPVERQFVFAYTHREVDELNYRLREVRRVSGRLGSDTDVPLDVCYKQPKSGEIPKIHLNVPFAPGDRIQFTGNDEGKGIFNGNLATITAMQPIIGTRGKTAWAITATIDAPGGKKVVRWTSDAFNCIRHGYAGTGWKGQGKTIDRTYHLFGPHWDAAMSYMLLTRHREDLRLFVASPAGEPNREWLARRMARRKITNAAINWDAKPGRRHADHAPQKLAFKRTGALTRNRAGSESTSDAGTLPAYGPLPADSPPVSLNLIVGRERFRLKTRQHQEDLRKALARRLLAEWDKSLAAYQQGILDNVDDAVSRRHRDHLATAAGAIVAQPWIARATEPHIGESILSDRPELQAVLSADDPGKAVEHMFADLRNQRRQSHPSLDSHPLDPRGRDPRDRSRGN